MTMTDGSTKADIERLIQEGEALYREMNERVTVTGDLSRASAMPVGVDLISDEYVNRLRMVVDVFGAGKYPAIEAAIFERSLFDMPDVVGELRRVLASSRG